MTESPNEIKYDGKDHAQQNGSSQGEIENRVLAPINNVARKPANGKAGSPEENQQQSYREQNRSKEDEQFS